MSKQLFKVILQLPEFKGKWRLVQAARASMNPYRSNTEIGFEMELDCFEWAQLHIAQHGNAEPLSMRLLTETLKPGDTYVDVGAHVGFVSLVARHAVGETGRVIAIEPQPYNCQHLLRNWEINGYTNLELHVAAAGDETGFVSLPQQTATDKSRLSLALPMHDATDLTFRIPIRTLASILEESAIDRVALLKIDVEGFELNVLKGLGDSIASVDNILFEALVENAAERSRSEAVCQWLVSKGFIIKDVQGRDWTIGEDVVEGNLCALRLPG